MANRSVMAHQFSQIPKAHIQRSSFDRSHGHKTTFDAGWLVPIFVDEALPGDTFNLSMTGFARLATPIKPLMDNMYMETFFFAVPNRLLWDNWQKMMGEQDNPGDSIDFTVPTVTIPPGIPQAASESIYDYFGLPIYATGNVIVNSMPLRAYNMIWNEWFRDQNLQTSVVEEKGDTDDVLNYAKLRRGKRHDYFTSCLPWPQKGDEVTIPTLDTAPVIGNGSPVWKITQGTVGRFVSTASTTDVNVENLAAGTAALQWDSTALVADLSSATNVSINELRTAFQWQKLLERDARGGTRYTEIIRAHFGVTSPDSRLQRPEFLGGGSSRVNIKPVEQTSISGGETPQGNLAAYGTAQLHNHGFTKSFTEHCYIIGLVNVRADLTYQQGCNRMWLRDQKYDFYWPALAHVGEQAVFTFELYSINNDGAQIQPTGPSSDGAGALATGPIFGYQERYAEYRYKPSQITGKFRSDDPLSLDVWHLSQDFAEEPQLNGEFIRDNPPIDRVIATQDEPHFLFDAYFQLRCARPMPLYGVPGNIDRF